MQNQPTAAVGITACKRRAVLRVYRAANHVTKSPRFSPPKNPAVSCLF